MGSKRNRLFIEEKESPIYRREGIAYLSKRRNILFIEENAKLSY